MDTKVMQMSHFDEIMKKQREFFAAGKTRDVSVRRSYMKKLKRAIKNNEKDIIDALYSDFRKAPFETYSTEIGPVLSELGDAIRHIKTWAKARRGKTPISHMPGCSKIYPEPYGAVLVIAPWNYPFNLAMSPLIGAIAAGNTVFLKPSEEAPAISSVMNRILSTVFPEEWVAVFEGEEVKKYILNLKFDYIFFTGGEEVGRIVMEKASVHLTPITLELGGKSPCIVADDADFKIAARRIAWGKYVNSGQTCIAPDYLLISEKAKKPFFKEFKTAVQSLYGDNPKANPDFPRIINDRHWARIEKLLHKGNTVIGGEVDRETKYIAPTLIDNVSPEDPVMQEEIFGPVLPVITVSSTDEIINFINSRPKPLALYIFTGNNKIKKRIINETSYGGGCVNDTLMHVANGHIPFGGVGLSGMGSYHGKNSFDTFTHYKSIYRNVTFFDNGIFRYAPYTKFGTAIAKLLLK